jgi:hypothetical protein
MRMHAQTPKLEGGFVYLPREAPWLAEYLHELTIFPGAKYDDQADSTSQALAWIAQGQAEPGGLGAIRRQLAIAHYQRGTGLTEIAEMARSTPDEVRIWIDEDAASRARLGFKNVLRPDIQGHCANCGKEVPYNVQCFERGGELLCSLDCVRAES